MSVASISPKASRGPSAGANEASAARGPTAFADVLADAESTTAGTPSAEGHAQGSVLRQTMLVDNGVAGSLAERHEPATASGDADDSDADASADASADTSAAAAGILAAAAIDVRPIDVPVARFLAPVVGATLAPSLEPGAQGATVSGAAGRLLASTTPLAMAGPSKRVWPPAIKSWLEEGRAADNDVTTGQMASRTAVQNLADAIEQHLLGQHRPPAQSAGASPAGAMGPSVPRRPADGDVNAEKSQAKRASDLSGTAAAVSAAWPPSPSSQAASSPAAPSAMVAPTSSSLPSSSPEASAPLQHLQAQLLDPAAGIFLDGRRAVVSLEGVTMVVSTSADGRTDVDLRTAEASTAASLGAERQVLARGLQQEGLSLDHLGVATRLTVAEPVAAVASVATSARAFGDGSPGFGDGSRDGSRERPEAPVVDDSKRAVRQPPASGDGPRSGGQRPGHITVQA